MWTKQTGEAKDLDQVALKRTIPIERTIDLGVSIQFGHRTRSGLAVCNFSNKDTTWFISKTVVDGAIFDVLQNKISKAKRKMIDNDLNQEKLDKAYLKLEQSLTE